MQRLAPTVVVLALLAATATAFALAERLKLERSPIVRPDIPSAFSPVCRCAQASARIRFRVRKGDRVTVAVVDGAERVVRTLADARHAPAGAVVETVWDGRDRNGVVVAEGTYRPLVLLPRQGRSLLLPNEIRVDTTPPRVTVRGLYPDDWFSPDGDRRKDLLAVRYAVAEKAHVYLDVDGVQRVRKKFKPLRSELYWSGRVEGRGLPPGTYELTVRAVDLAGNVTRADAGRIRIRYVELARNTLTVQARTRFAVRVRADARSFRWRFAGGTGRSRPGVLILRAPRAGRYRLFVDANGRADSMRVVVRPRR